MSEADVSILPLRRFSHVVIRASAGSGKTFQLSNRFLALLYQGVPPERILAVTFTRKAAGEIFDRIVLRLADAAADDKKRRELADNIDAPDLSAEQCRELLMSVTRALHRLRVGTLDSFFSKIAGSCSMELGLPIGWSIVEELVDARLRDRAIADSLADGAKGRVHTLLNLLTKGEAARSISQLIRDTVRELYNVVRETEESAWKQVPRFQGLPPEELAETYERLQGLSFPDKNFAKAVAKDVGFVVARDWASFIGKGLASKVLAGETTYCRKPISDEALAIYETLLKQAKSELVNVVASQTEATYDLLTHFDEHYRRLKLAQAALRFDDITFTLARSKASDDERVTFRLDATIDHLLLDEFQDTSLSQWLVLKPIAHRVATTAAGTSFFCVGDVKQAIYGWRGGLAELFDTVRQELPGIEEKPLDTSYRSSQAVIDVVNRAFARLQLHPDLGKYEAAVRKWQKRFNPHSTARTELAGYVTLETCRRVEEDEDANADDVFNEFVASRVAEAYERYPGMTIGVLTRTNDAVGQIIYRLRSRDIPASEEGGNPLTDSAAVELILSLVRLADHPGDTTAAYHVARSPLGAHFDISPKNYEQTAILSERLRRELLDSGYGRAVYRWCQLVAPACDVRDRSRLQQLVELAYSYQAQSTLRPSDFLEYVEGQRVSDPTTSVVRVMTVHQAKGLEFDLVFLPELDSKSTLIGQTPWLVTSRKETDRLIDCVCRYAGEDVQQLLPKPFQKMFENAIEGQISEALCVLYVALTRAVHGLFMLVRPVKENEKTLPKTFTGLLRAALCEESSPKEGMLFSHGAADWFEQEKKRRKVGKAVAAPTAPTPAAPSGPTKITLAPPPHERRRGLQRESPSRLEGGAAGRVRRALELSDPKRDLAMLRGTVFHAWFEQVIWLDDALPSDEQLVQAFSIIRGVEIVSVAEQKAWLNEFRAMLSRGDTPQVLKRSSYCSTLPKGWKKLLAGELQLEAKNEWPFAVIDGTQLLQGRMDRVVFLLRDGQPIAADVLDYKTDVIAEAAGQRIEDRVEHYRPQVEAYCRTVAQQTGLPENRVTAGLLFVGPGTLWRPEASK
jgi:ATP-dependent exoDNAse (exonuclease V) beta subunit